MDVLIGLLDIVYGFIGLMFVAGAGALMLMFAFVQITARLAIWLDVTKAYTDRKDLATEVVQLKAALDTLAAGDEALPDPNKPLVTAIKVNDPSPRKVGLGPPQ